MLPAWQEFLATFNLPTFYHMIADSFDSFVVLLLVAPFVQSRRGSLQLILMLGGCDALASFFGPTLIHLFSYPLLSLVATLSYVATFAYIVWCCGSVTPRLLLALPVVMSFDNLLQFPTHEVHAFCAVGFGFTSAVLAGLGLVCGKLSVRLVSLLYRVSKVSL